MYDIERGIFCPLNLCQLSQQSHNVMQHGNMFLRHWPSSNINTNCTLTFLFYSFLGSVHSPIHVLPFTHILGAIYNGQLATILHIFGGWGRTIEKPEEPARLHEKHMDSSLAAPENRIESSLLEQWFSKTIHTVPPTNIPSNLFSTFIPLSPSNSTTPTRLHQG